MALRLAFEGEGGPFEVQMVCAYDGRGERVSRWPSALEKMVVGGEKWL